MAQYLTLAAGGNGSKPDVQKSGGRRLELTI
jgi:hypothetical protein